MFNYSPLKCSGCDSQFPFPHGACVYTDLAPASNIRNGDIDGATENRSAMHHWQIPLLIPAWCLHCDRATFVERIPSAAEFRNAAGIRKLQDKNVRQGFDDELLYIDDDSFRKLHEFCVNRTATPKCILCGNSSYVEIDLYKRETGLNHDQCWGSPILAQGIIVGGSVGPPDGRVRFLNRDGKLLWATTNSYKMYQYWLKAVLHVPATHPDGTNFRTTINAIVNGELDTALKILKPYCESGDVSGLSIMGALHYIGKGVEHDGIRARDLLNVAMEQGDLGACHNLASLYCTGAPGIERDVANGWKLFHRAKKVGAQFELDDFFKKGQDDYYPYYRPNQ